MQAIEVKVVGDKALIKKLQNLRGFFTSEKLRTVLEESKNLMVTLAMRLAPIGESGMLARTIHGQLKNFGTEDVEIEVGSPMQYARFVELSTKRHPIDPVNRRILFWLQYGSTHKSPTKRGSVGDRRDIEKVFRLHVKHPGTKAQPFLRPALRTVYPRTIQAIRRLLNAEIKGA